MNFLKSHSIRLGYLSIAIALAGCGSFSVKDRVEYANTLASEKNWIAEDIASRHFILRTFHPKDIKPHKNLWVYIEGDGFAWVTRSQPSLDPTPLNPMALKMALSQPQGNAVYLSRPCQFIREANPNCEQIYWTQKRFSKEVISASFDAIESLKKLYQAEKLILVGYSGGASIASVITAMRNDVSYLITVAGNLDHTAWTNFHNISPLKGSVNPIQFTKALSTVEQIHLSGERDSIVPPELLFKYSQRFLGNPKFKTNVIYGYDHHCCWTENWADIWYKKLIKEIRQKELINSKPKD